MTNKPAFDYSGTELECLAAAANYHDWILSRFRPYLGHTVVEVGAGIGSISKKLLQSPIQKLYALEPSRNLFPRLSKALAGDSRATPINGTLQSSDFSDGVDCVIYLNVLEHIEDDAAELALAHRVLRRGGHLLVFSPALPWLYSDFDRHVGHYRRYTKKSIAELSARTGYRVVTARYFDLAGILPWYVSFVLLKAHPRPGSVALYDKLLVPPMRMLESILPPPIGKNVLLVARKD